MARYYVECQKCGNEFQVQLFGKNKDREWKLKNWDWVCDECLKKKKKKKNKKAAEANLLVGLPELTGTEKQIAWAETIRQDKIKQLEQMVKKIDEVGINVKNGLQNQEELAIFEIRAIENLKGRTEASWWIDSRFDSPMILLQEEVKLLLKRKHDFTSEAEIAKAEAMVRPSKVVTETVAEIRVVGDEIRVEFFEKNYDFWFLIKRKMGFRWSGSYWSRKVNKFNGSIENRVAEVGYRLLAAGFIICIFNESLRQKAISGDYAPEQTRWITKLKDENCFAIWWDHKIEDFYSEARKITSSRWERPYVTVPPEHFEEVLDFAEIHGFKLSEGAMALVKKIEEERASAMVVDVSLMDEEAIGPKERPVLDPEQVSGDPNEDLLDN